MGTFKRGFAGLNEINNPVDVSGNLSNEISSLSEKVIFARVTDIVLDNKHPKFATYGSWNGLGTIDFEFVDKLNADTPQSSTAIPLIASNKNYPLVNEIVVLFLLPKKLSTGGNTYSTSYYYLNPVSIWNHPHQNALPKVNIPNNNEESDITYESIEDGSNVSKVDSTNSTVSLNGNNPSGGVFIDNGANVRPLLPFVGDIITEGRFGNSIRLGSTVQSQGSPLYQNNWSRSGSISPLGSPITILRNGQPTSGSAGWIPLIENVNEDPSSIYLTSTQTIPILNSSEIYDSLKTPPTLPREYNKNQIILSSGRLVFNSSIDSILLSSIKDISLSSENEIGMDSKKAITFSSNKVNLGSKNATEAVIKGTSFMEQFEILVQQLENITEALTTARVWDEGVSAPDPVIVPIATNAAANIKDLKKMLQDPTTNPLLSQITRTI